MTLWVLNHIPTWAIATLMLGGLPLLAVLGCALIRRRVPSLADGENNEVAGVVVSVMGGIYGIVLAFVIVVLWEQLQSAQSVVAHEGTALSQIIRDSRAFSDQARQEVTSAVGEYVHAVSEHEWGLMSVRRESPLTEQAIDHLYAALQRYDPVGTSAGAFYNEVSSKLDDVIADRRQRLRYGGYGLPGVLEVLLVGGAFMIIGFLYFFGTRSERVHLLMSGAVAALLAFNLLLALMLEHPFAGGVAVDRTTFRQGELAQFWPTQTVTLP
jgi:Protein of unknown function (DUF4239)